MTLRWKIWVAGSVIGMNLGTCSSLPAQTPPRSAYTAQARPGMETVQPVEAMIESAWLADPLTFQYALKAVVTPQGVELRGLVPTQMLKQRAVSVAQGVSSAAVIDQLQVQPNMEILLPGTASPNFAEEAAERLAKVSPEQAGQVNVQMGIGGVVTLSGHVTSLEDKLRFARSLRGLTGCAAVRNNLVIGSGLQTTATLGTPTPVAPVTTAAATMPAPIIRMEPTQPPPPAKTEPIRLHAEAPAKGITLDVHGQPAKAEVAVKPQVPAPQEKKSVMPMTPPAKTVADKPATPAVKPAVVKQETPKPVPQGTPVQIIFD
jgi:osmotically-inducible protein OsmY